MMASTAEDTTSTGRLRQSLGHAWLITRVKHRRVYRRLYRQMADNHRTLIVGGVLTGIFYLLLIAGAVRGAYILGTAVGTDMFTEQLALARTIIAGMAIGVALMVSLRTVQEYGDLDEPAPVLTAIPYQEAVWELLLMAYIEFVELAVVPILAVAVAFAVGAGSVASIPVITVVLLAVVALSTTAGFVLGQLLTLSSIRVAFVRRYKTLIGVLAFVVYFIVAATGALANIFKVDWTVIGASPLGWVADLALVVAPTSLIGITRPTVAAVTLLVGSIFLTWFAVRLTGAVWYADPVQPDDDTDDRNTASGVWTGGLSSGFSERLFGGRLSHPTLRIAQKSWRRAYRVPLKIQFAVLPGLFLIGPIRQSLEAGEITILLPISIAIYGAWATGAAFTLNPLGDEGAVLPLTLISGIRGTQFLRGLLFAGIAIGGPLTVVLAMAVGFASPMDVFSAIVTGMLGGILCVSACAIGVGVGTAFPKFDPLSSNNPVVVPGMLAFAVYSLVFFLVLLPGLFGSFPPLTQWLSGQVDLSTQILTLAGLAGTTLLAGGAGWIGLRSAESTIDGYTLVR
jgi:ABC-2 type transport system permease protein